jgi:electron transfer flavoprotein alpha subunit
MSLTIDKDLCTACGSCEEVCPFGAIEIIDDLAVVNDQCTLCGACVISCPTEAITLEREAEVVVQGHQGVWVFAEQRHNQLAQVGFELLGEGRRLAESLQTSLTAVLFGHEVKDLSAQLFAYGADKVVLADHPDLAGFTDDVYGDLLTALIREHKPEIVLCGATSMGRSFFPKTANALDTGLTADCTGLAIRREDRLLMQTRPAFGGNIMATILCPARRPQMATVRPKVMKPGPYENGRSGELVQVDVEACGIKPRTRFLETVADFLESVPLAEADVIVAGGRGVGSEKGFDMLKELAGLLNGAVGASRGAVDEGLMPYPHQVGQTGKTVAPKLYIACGISGAVQHLVGMQTSDVIVAINNDSGAPIFDVADFAMVGDLNEIVPALIRTLKNE